MRTLQTVSALLMLMAWSTPSPADDAPAPPTLKIPKGAAVVVDGDIGTEEWRGVQPVTIALAPGWSVAVYCRHDKANLYVAFDRLANSGVRFFPDVLVDLTPNPPASWQERTWWFHVSDRFCRSSGRRDPASCSDKPAGFTAKASPASAPVSAEIAIPLASLGKLRKGGSLSLAFDVNDESSEWYLWPPNATKENPSSWAKATFE